MSIQVFQIIQLLPPHTTDPSPWTSCSGFKPEQYLISLSDFFGLVYVHGYWLTQTVLVPMLFYRAYWFLPHCFNSCCDQRYINTLSMWRLWTFCCIDLTIKSVLMNHHTIYLPINLTKILLDCKCDFFACAKILMSH